MMYDTTLAIETLRQQLCEDDDEGKSFESSSRRNNTTASIVDTPAMWYPLQLAKDNVHAAQANLSVQLQISFICETKAYDIRQKIVQRAATRKRSKNKVHGGATGMTADEKLHGATSIADPAFASTKPFHPIDWSSVVSTSLRHIFFHADVDRLSSFATQVLYGDLVRELQDDPGLHVHEDHVAAFQMCQFSAQYLDHCVNTLAARKDDYCGQYRVLAESHEKLVQTRSQLCPLFVFKSQKRQRDRLKKQSNELELLLTTYKSIAEKESLSIPVEEAMPSERIGNLHDMHQQRSRTKPPTKLAQENSPKADSVKKPVFLMTWEERERERKLDKELSKEQRIEDEKRRLEQLALDRKAQDEHQLRLSSLLARGRERAACVIQRLTRQKNAEYKLKFAAQRHRAAVAIQRHVRGYKCRKVYPLRLEQHKIDIESNLMEQNDLEMCVFLQREEQQRQQHHTIRVQSLSHDCGPESPSPNKQEVGDLVSMWRKLRRIFVLAHSSSGTQYRSLFQKLDLRQDGLVDRAEFSLGVRSFGIRIDRKLTRALIALVRAKSGSPSQPLLINLDQFVRGFDLPQQDSGTSEAPIESTYDREIQEAKQSKRDDGANSNDVDSYDTATRVAQAVENLRQKIVDAATSYLEATGKSISNYRDFHDALTYVFGEFDVDGNGELDMNEFVACIESINFRVTEDNLALLRECFAWDHESDRIGIVEFISFALARPDGGGDENLGAAGSRMRDAILQRVRSARKQTDTIEDAVRFVFRRAYRTKADQRCSVAIFMRTLAALQLGIKPAQLARLAMQLDKDGDRSISFDELLIWLRLRSPSAEVKPIDAPTNHFERRMPTSSAIAKLVRALLHQIAGVDLFTSSQTSRQGLLRRVFEKIDCNNSKKITKQEIQQFLGTKDLGSMQDLVDAIAGQESSPKSRPAVLADAIVSSIDLNRNGVITLDE
ncbi:Ef-hand domain pair, partial [Globisporangium splendens]